MASPINPLTRCEEPDYVETRIKCFSAFGRSKKLKDERNTGRENQILVSFLASSGCEAIMKIAVMVYLRGLEDMKFEEVFKVKKEFETKEETGHWGEDEIPVKNTRTE